MAFTTRGARETSLQQDAADYPGPGAFAVDTVETEHRTRSSSLAPFASTSPRKDSSLPEAAHPGPGQYAPSGPAASVATDENKPHGSSRDERSSAFRSSVPQHVADALVSSSTHETPAPGTYTADLLHASRFRRAPGPSVGPPASSDAKAFGSDTADGRYVATKTTQSAPSVPAAHQSFGYEENESGMLIQQPPPQGSLPGEGASGTAGPGEYSPELAARHRYGGSHWIDFSKGTGKAAFEAASPNAQQQSVPAPGTYNPPPGRRTDSTAPRPGQRLWSASFVSTVPRKHQQYIKEDDAVPGPGSFERDVTPIRRSGSQKPNHFGSTQRRQYEVDEASALGSSTSYKTPGPGAHSQEPSRVSHATSVQHGARQVEMQPFSSGEERFAHAASSIRSSSAPAPGSYSQHDFVTELNGRIASRSGAFGSNKDRFVQPDSGGQEHSTPPPGMYDPRDWNRKQRSKKGRPLVYRPRQGSPAQKASAEKVRHVQQQQQNLQKDVPGPTQYDVQRSWAKTVSRGAIGTSTGKEKRFTETKHKGDLPPPGSYNPKQPSTTISASMDSRSSFRSGTARMVPEQSGNPPAIGPGAYTGDVSTESPMLKQSFNVTLMY